MFKSILCCLLYLNIAYCSNASYISLSGQLSNKLQIDILANNLANKSTKGFIGDIPTLRTKEIKRNKRKLYFAALNDLSLDNSQVSLKPTGRDLDLAIKGPGCFKVLVAGEERYTRNGSMYVSRDGRLVTHEGFSFLDSDNKEIFTPIGEPGKFNVAENGEIFLCKAGENDLIGQIGVFEFTLADAKKDSSGYIQSSETKAKEDCCVIQGYLSESNVDHTKTLHEILNLRNSLECNMNLLANSFRIDKSAVETLKVAR